ncbi:16S rRNA (cytosine(1402)-N(4))-methyltransferase [Bacillus sp. M6-12]|uniref:class I SAM-dependent methyltransferase n=1 Tax=Bacillus sp. M6-12 TaxID=2054166 RepID=UPI000C7923DF|nr:class I SAM-dependent methyltransferase [Bacillus sp. M6-12]PLS14935.1 16S rRNA (cytosine(1402)-N(4))-methyltransferase [Bacillus sp. M6-12]
MKLDRILPFARLLLQKAVNIGDIAVDGTMGNGHDTEFLANLVGESGHVYGFDIQDQAVTETEKRLKSGGLNSRCTLFLAGHEHIKDKIPEKYHGKVTGAIFNLGYLPGGDKSIVTAAETTITAIEQLLEVMAAAGIIVLVIYHGHPEGTVERDAILEFAASLPQDKAHVLQYRFINQANNPPFIVALEKR